MARLIDADKLKQDHFMSNECETCINDAGRCQNWHSYTKMDFCGWIDDAPTVDAEPVKHGHWIGKPIAGYSTVRCSECGDVFMENSGKWNYCPNCGAKMDEVKEDD